MSGRDKIVKVVMKCFGAYLCYSIVTIAAKEVVVERARVIKEQQVRYGGDFQLSEEKQQILNQAEQYLDNHIGYRYLNRSRTEQFFKQQLSKKLHQKQQALKETPPEEQQKVNKLMSQIDQLKKAYTSVAPKMPTSWDDLKEKDEDE